MLTDKQRAFVAEYLKDLNATQAAIRAGYSPNSARQVGAENLSKPYIAEAVKKAQDERAERTRVDTDKVVRELAKLGFSDMRELAAWTQESVEWKSSDELTDEAAAAVKAVDYQHEVRYDRNGDRIETHTHKLHVHDKKGALELLGRHLGMFKDNLNINNDRPFEVRVRGLGKESA
jgi:phage terminase small subunit